MFRKLADEYPWASPEVVSNMTIPQTMIYLKEAEEMRPRFFEKSIRFRDRFAFERWFRKKQKTQS